MSRVLAFLRFWWDFVVGDDWRIAAAVVIGLVVTAILAHHGVPAWWVLPLTVLGVLVVPFRALLQPRRRSKHSAAERNRTEANQNARRSADALPVLEIDRQTRFGEGRHVRQRG